MLYIVRHMKPTKLSRHLQRNQITASAMAKALGVSESFVSQWLRGKRPVPVRFCVAIESDTAGEVSRKDLRPADWETIWPELVDAA